MPLGSKGKDGNEFEIRHLSREWRGRWRAQYGCFGGEVLSKRERSRYLILGCLFQGNNPGGEFLTERALCGGSGLASG